jgi:hypothetical protein
MVEEMLAARGISVSYETIRQWGLKFGREFANRIRRQAPRRGDKRHLDEVVITIAGTKHWLWRAVDQKGFAPLQICSFRQARRIFMPCFSTNHSPAPQSFNPVLSTSKCTGGAPMLVRDRGCGTSQFFTRIFSLPDMSQDRRLSAFGSQKAAAYAYSDQ